MNYRRTLIYAAALASALTHDSVLAVSNATYTVEPPGLLSQTEPLVMISLSRDHQLFQPAYNSYTDLDGDGLAEHTYNNSINYVGYFDFDKCYQYSSAAQRFIPNSYAPVDPNDTTRTTHYCDGQGNNLWSGNFLNWATMTRADVIRKVLYGGYRSTDTTSLTVLERSFLPKDAHSFARHYEGADVKKLVPSNFSIDLRGNDTPNHGITLCNTTPTGNGLPTIRVAAGNFGLWASGPEQQCRWQEEAVISNGNDPDISGYDAQPLNPAKNQACVALRQNGTCRQYVAGQALGAKDYVSRVTVCSDVGLLAENCSEYSVGEFTAYKPVGLLQRFGEPDLIKFGLITGSYAKNKSGGVLRKGMSSLNSEINDDGTFDKSSDSIINSIDLLRLVEYDYETTVYSDCTSPGISSFSDGQCKNWGNPQSEIFLEAIRYLAGESSATSDYSAVDTGIIPGLTTATWDANTILSTENQCADLSLISFNASVSSYDSDGVLGDALGAYADDETNTIGDNEGITGSNFVLSDNGGFTDIGMCSSKTVGDFANVLGLCPEAPRLEGSYLISGLAKYAHSTDLWDTLDGDQVVSTFGITMAPDQPIIEVGVGGSPVTIYPACESVNTSDPDENNRPRGSCAIVDFRILENDGIEGKYLIQWEDSAQGSNYDMDLWGVLSYEVSGSNITVTTVAEAHTNFAMGMGYYINGTNKDGLHIHTGHSGVDDFYFYDDSVSGVSDCSGGCKTLDGPTSSTYTAQTSSVIPILEPPLFFAAKYGGFDDKDESGLPDQVGEWDVRNNFTSAAGPDGLPDNYYHIINPAQLDVALDNTLLEIIANKEVSGTSAAILANSSGGDGEIVQALYFPQRENLQQGKTVEWSGELQSFFIDSYGLFREDTNGNAVLDGYDSDYVFEYFVDINNNLRIDRFTLLDPSKPPDDESNQLVQVDTIDGVDIHPLWSAREALGNLSNTNIRTQRTYSDQVNTSTSGRYIFTYIDKDLDGEVDNGEVKDFVSSMITADLGSDPETWRFFGTASTILAQVTIDYVRGYEHPALPTRSREIDFDNDPDTADIVLRLGDIIHSTPVIVAEPTGNYDDRYGDTSYDAFETKYQNRRRVTYVGANDGMLHAFNSGFLDTSASNTTYVTSLVNETAHPLGAELWAYVPFNLLPHLQWLPNQNYAHTYYVDGEPQVFDVKIFDGDPDTSATALHPNGWGTILVVGMRLGGGDFPLDLDADTGTNNESPACKDLCTRSAYIVLDITDPESPPTLLAEITDNNLNFTIGQPSLIKDRTLDGLINDWALAFGSGPKNATDVTTNENAKFFVYDLIDNQFIAINRRDVIKDSGVVQNSFVGDTSSADLDQDYQDDVVYFGLNSTTSSGGVVTHTGDLYRYVIPNNDFEMLLKVDRPVFSRPLSYLDGNDRSWVYFGTGRFLGQKDLGTNAQQTFYGVMEPIDVNDDYTWAEVSLSDLQDVTDVEVGVDGVLTSTSGLSPLPADSNSNGDIDFVDLKHDIQFNRSGWYRDLEVSISGGSSAKSFTAPDILRSLVFFTDFTPKGNQCAPGGESNLYVVSFATGTATDFGALGSSNGTTNNVLEALGAGQASAPALFIGGDQVDRGRAMVQQSGGNLTSTEIRFAPPGGAINSVTRRISWRELEID